ncbi:MAG: DUF4160 domain-containing protein [Magnetococcus sp. YQC-5]
MPVISMFYGIIVFMCFMDDECHHIPHIHVQYQDYKAVYSLLSGECLAGTLTPGKTKLIQAWIEIHQDELLANWQLAVQGKPLFRIKPLK